MKLILITLLGLVVGLMVACGEKTPPTPSYPQISEDEAIALVKQTLRGHQLGNGRTCYYYLAEYLTEASPATGVEKVKGTWEVTWEAYTVSQRDGYVQSDTVKYKWIVYPTTRSIARTDNNGPGYGGCP
jgi:hypothetical protein